MQFFGSIVSFISEVRNSFISMDLDKHLRNAEHSFRGVLCCCLGIIAMSLLIGWKFTVKVIQDSQGCMLILLLDSISLLQVLQFSTLYVLKTWGLVACWVYSKRWMVNVCNLELVSDWHNRT